MENELKAGDVVEINGKKYRAESEVEKGTCIGCDLFVPEEPSCGYGVPRCIPFIFKEVKDVLRRLELGVVKVDGDNVTFRIVTQTHRCGEFSQQSRPNIFKASNGVELKSINVPEWKGDDSLLFCSGKLCDSDNNKLTCTATDFARISEAITEYNATNGKGYEEPWPQIGNVYYFVTDLGVIFEFTYTEDAGDVKRRELGNFFCSREEAEEAAEKIKALLKELAAK